MNEHQYDYISENQEIRNPSNNGISKQRFNFVPTIGKSLNIISNYNKLPKYIRPTIYSNTDRQDHSNQNVQLKYTNSYLPTKVKDFKGIKFNTDSIPNLEYNGINSDVINNQCHNLNNSKHPDESENILLVLKIGNNKLNNSNMSSINLNFQKAISFKKSAGESQMGLFQNHYDIENNELPKEMITKRPNPINETIQNISLKKIKKKE